VALWAGPVLARYRRLATVGLALLFVLTLARARIWRSDDALWLAAEKVAPTPRGLDYLAAKELLSVHEALELLNRTAPSERAELEERMLGHARATVRHVDGFFELYRDVIRLPPSGLAPENLVRKANALVILGRPKEALPVAEQAIEYGAGASAYFNVALAYQDLGNWELAARHFQAAYDEGFDFSDLRPRIAGMWFRAALTREQGGDLAGAARHYRRAWRAFPDPEHNAPALEALRRVGG
jgi:tetratricopeptide (TPR) repeat protein